MKFNWKYTAIGIAVLAISLAATAFLVGGESSSSDNPVIAPSPSTETNYNM